MKRFRNIDYTNMARVAPVLFLYLLTVKSLKENLNSYTKYYIYKIENLLLKRKISLIEKAK